LGASCARGDSFGSLALQIPEGEAQADEEFLALAFRETRERDIVDAPGRLHQRRLQGPRTRRKLDDRTASVRWIGHPSDQAITLHSPQRVCHRGLLDIGPLVQFGLRETLLLPEREQYRELAGNDAVRSNSLMQGAREQPRQVVYQVAE
jgi:hypothetical protein